MAKYEFEVWNSVDVHTMDITSLVQNARYSIQRNDAERLDFEMDLTAFEELCESIGEDAPIALRPYTSDVKVKRNGEYLFGTQVAELLPVADERGSRIQVSCDGYLSLLTDRYVNGNYSQVDGSEIAWDMIQRTNLEEYDGQYLDTGIRRGVTYLTGFPRDRNYELQNIREGIVNLTKLREHRFDFDFSHDRKFNTYEKLGSQREDILLSYPASEVGIPALSIRMPREARGTLYNYGIGFGSGFGDEALRYSVIHPDSVTTYGLRVKIMNYNDISQLPTLTEHVRSEITKSYDVLRLPEFTVSGDVFDLNDIRVGDRIRAYQKKYKMLWVDGIYRIEKLDVQLDENFSELIKVTLDNYEL